MKRLPIFLAIFVTGCASQSTEIKRLSPIMSASKAPVQCQVVSVVNDSPAEKAGIILGDVIKSVNGQAPADASAFPDLVSSAREESDFEIFRKDGSTQTLKIKLNSTRPRLGTVCDLAGWEKPGLTSAGNESVTVFEGPYALTASGIIDKGILFVRLRLSNNSDKPIDVGPQLVTASDSTGTALPIMDPKEVMCFLYGDKGAHLLALKKKHNETLDAHESVPAAQPSDDEKCPAGTQAKLSSSDPKFVDANAQYVATESLWPANFAPGKVADGLIYLKDTPNLPVTVKVALEGQAMSAQLGLPAPSQQQLSHGELVRFFESQKRGNAVRITLRKGKVFVAKFSSYDDNGERVWFTLPSAGPMSSTSYSISSIRHAQPLEQIPATPTPARNDLN